MTNSKWNKNESLEVIEELYRRNDRVFKRLVDLDRRLSNQDTPPPLPRIDPDAYPDPYEGQRAIDPNDEQHMWYSDGEWRKAGGLAVYEIKIFEDVNVVVVGDGIFWWPIPEDLGLSEIIKVEAGVSVPSSSGSVQIQLRHFTSDGTNDTGDVLTNKITIDANEMNSRQASVQPTITGGTREVGHGDWLRVDIDAAGVGAQGLALMVTLSPSPLGSVVIAGSQGPPGGITDWTGAWVTSTVYTVGQAVSHNGSSYVVIQNHTSGSLSEPGVGADWEDYWMLLAGGEQLKTSGFDLAINGNGYQIVPGLKIYRRIPFACTITEMTLLADRIGSIVIDIWKDTYGNYPPTDADSIVGSNPPTLSTAIKTTDTALTGWTTSLAAGDVLGFSVDSCSIITFISLQLQVDRV